MHENAVFSVASWPGPQTALSDERLIRARLEHFAEPRDDADE